MKIVKVMFYNFIESKKSEIFKFRIKFGKENEYENDQNYEFCIKIKKIYSNIYF